MRIYYLIFINLFVFSVHAESTSKPTRIISLIPHATEMAFAAGLGDKIIAVSECSDYPPQAEKIEKVANFQGINLERIISLKPDLIIAWQSGSPNKEIDKLKRLKFPIYFLNIQTVDDIATHLEQLSHYAEEPAIGKNAANEFRQSLSILKQRYHSEIKTRFFYQLSAKPIITISQGRWPSEVFEFCGGENIFAESITPYPQVNIEQVLIAKPDIIFTSSQFNSTQTNSPWMKWKEQLPAVKNQFLWSLNADWLDRPTPRVIKAIEEVCHYMELSRQTTHVSASD